MAEGAGGRVPVPGDRRPADHHRRGQGRYGEADPDGPPHLRRRGLRQNRDRRARRLQGRAGFQAGGRTRADHAARPAALRDLLGALRGLPRHRQGDEPLPDHQGDQRHDQGASGRHRGRGHRHAQTAQPQDPVQGPGAGHHRRGATLRRRTQGDAQGAAHQRGRALPVRHADPAHAGDGGDRHPRDVHARHPAGGPPAGAHLRGRLRGRAGHRGDPARAAARRPGVLRAQPRGRHLPHGRQDPGARARSQGRHRPRQDGREAARPNHPRLLAPRHQRARMHHDHRNRPGYLEREHADRGPRRPLRPEPAAPAARPRRPRPRTRLCVLPVRSDQADDPAIA